MSTERLATARYRLLLDQLRTEFASRSDKGSDYGWKTWAAKRLEIRNEYVGMLLKHLDRNVGGDVVERAITNVGLSPRFFYDESLGEDPSYLDYVGPDPSESGATTAPGSTGIDPADERTLLYCAGELGVKRDEIDRLKKHAAIADGRGQLSEEWFAAMLRTIRTQVGEDQKSGTRKKGGAENAQSGSGVGQKRGRRTKAGGG